MESSDEAMERVGSLEPSDARRYLGRLEQLGIPFELEEDHSDLVRPDRFLRLSFGMHAGGSKLVVYVPTSRFKEAQQEWARLYPV